jgi:hypothetical protein
MHYKKARVFGVRPQNFNFSTPSLDPSEKKEMNGGLSTQ